MSNNEVLFARLAIIFDESLENITLDYKFADEAWDSLTLMAVAACLDEVYDIVVPVKSLADCEDMRQLLALVEAEKNEA